MATPGMDRFSNALVVLLLGALAGCANFIATNADTFDLPADAGKNLRAGGTVALRNVYQAETKTAIWHEIIYNRQPTPIAFADLRQYTGTAITMLTRQMNKKSVIVEPQGSRTVTLKVYDVTLGTRKRPYQVQSNPVLWIVEVPLALIANAEDISKHATFYSALRLEAVYGDGTRSTITSTNGSNWTAARAMDAAMMVGISLLLEDEAFVAYINTGNSGKKPEAMDALSPSLQQQDQAQQPYRDPLLQSPPRLSPHIDTPQHYRGPPLQSLPKLSPQIGTLRLVAYPLNASAREGQRPFVICVVPEIPDGSAVSSQMQTATFDPTRIVLTLGNGTSVKPSGYALPARCPYPEERPDVRDSELVFREIDFTRPLVWRRDMTEPVTELALRFDLATPSPRETFSLQLGSLSLNEAQHLLPKIEFSRMSASSAIPRRATSQGSDARQQSPTD